MYSEVGARPLKKRALGNGSGSSSQERGNLGHVMSPLFPQRGVARVLELDMGDPGYIVQEWLDYEVLRNVVIAVDHQGGDLDIL